MWGILIIMILWAILIIGAVVLADMGNKKGFYYCFGGCILLIGVLFIVSVWMMS